MGTKGTYSRCNTIKHSEWRTWSRVKGDEVLWAKWACMFVEVSLSGRGMDSLNLLSDSCNWKNRDFGCQGGYSSVLLTLALSQG